MPFLLAAMLTLAQTAAVTPPATPKEKKICRSEGATGSYFVKRTCHTKAEWEAIEQANQHDTDTYRNRGEHSSPNG